MKYVLLALFMINTVIWATPLLAAPVVGKLEMPTHRVDGKPIVVGPIIVDGKIIAERELVKVKVYFHETLTNQWTNITLTDDLTQFSVDKPPGTYEIFATVFNYQGAESGPSNKITRGIGEEPIIIEIPLTQPMPPILILIN